MAGHNITQNRMTAGRAIISALVLWLAFSGVAAAEQFYVNESGWWRDGGAFNASETPIQEVIDAATPGDSIFVYNGTYYEGSGVSITKDGITLQGEDVNTTTIHGRWTAENVVQVTGDYMNVSGFTVAGSALYGSGIYVNADYCTISDNIASSNYYGIRLDSSSNCVLENNIASSNENHGIFLSSSSNCVLTNNTASDENVGIGLSSSSNCMLTNNTVSSNNGNDGIRLSSSSNNNTIIGNNVSNNWNGIYLGSTSINNNIKENAISGNTNYGMYLDWSGDNEIYHNNFVNNNVQAYDHHGFNEWDKGSIIGGNYWSDHVCHGNPSDGTELYTGIDTDAGAVDNYPFENRDGWVSSITNLHNTSYEQTYINWTWTDPVNESFSKVMVYLDGIFQANVTKGVHCYNATELAPDTEHTLSTRTVDTAGNIDESWINHTARTKPIPDTTAPASITSLDNTTYEQTYINWAWTDPADADFSKVMVYLDGIYKEDVLKGVQCYTATGLTDDTEHEIATRTVDDAGNINATWVNDTARTAPIPDTPPPPLNITSHAPPSPVNDMVGATRTFNITIDQTANVSWQINGTEVQLNESVKEAFYTNMSAAIGTWNVSAIASNANGTATQTWWWNVREQPKLNITKAQTDKSAYILNENVMISCIVQNKTGMNSTADNVRAELTKPDSSIEWITLSEGLTGNYNGTFTNTSLAGIYNVTIYANKAGYVNDTAELSFEVVAVDTTDPIVNSVTLNRTDVTDGDPILVTVNATDNFGVTSVTAEGVALTPLPGNIWEGIIIAVTGNDVVVNVSARDDADNIGWNNSTSYTARWIREDVYPDGWITITDIVRVGDHFGEIGEPGWIPEDVYPDGWITITDIVRVGDHFGETKP